jgi:signal recognition particle subunit SRP54
MAELTEIKNTIDVTETLLVIDAMAGQDAVNVAKQFNETIGLDGVIVTKLDGDTRGGSALSVKAVTGKPIKFIGTGEKLDDLELFHPDRMASRILGMGDVLSLIEKAEIALDEKKAEELEKKLRQNKLDLNDMLMQFEEMKKMGPMKDLLSMIPGLNKKVKDVDVDDKQIDYTMAIIRSMTLKERENPDIINPSRKRRIAAGCGMQVEDVNRLLNQYRSMQKLYKQLNGKGSKKMMKRMQRMGMGGGMPGGMGGFPM